MGRLLLIAAALSQLLVLQPRAAASMPRWFTFFGDDPASQHAWSNLGHSDVAGIASSWSRYGRHGLLHLSGWAVRPNKTGQPSHCHHTVGYGCPVGGLSPNWRAEVEKQLDDAMPLIRNGTIKGLFLGDEPCCIYGSPCKFTRSSSQSNPPWLVISRPFLTDSDCWDYAQVWALETVAAFCKAKTRGTGAFTYVNIHLCGLPFDPRVACKFQTCF